MSSHRQIARNPNRELAGARLAAASVEPSAAVRSDVRSGRGIDELRQGRGVVAPPSGV